MISAVFKRLALLVGKWDTKFWEALGKGDSFEKMNLV